MAKISPYADPSAHGKITPGLCFKRRGRIVQLGKCPRPKDKKSAAQIAQREKMVEAVAKYKILNNDELIFLRRRGSMISKNPYMLYTSSQLVGNDWSKEHGHQLQIINNMVIFDLIQDQLEEIRFSLISSLSIGIINNIALWNRLDSETAGVITSDQGPNLEWTGTPSHVPVEHNDGAFTNSNANYLRPTDNGDFLTPIINKHMFGFWFKPSFDCINGIPQDANFHSFLDWVGNNIGPFTNWYDVFFHPAAGLRIRINAGGLSKAYDITSTDLTFNSGDDLYLAWIYDREGIDGQPEKIKVVFGNASSTIEIFSSTEPANEMVATAQSCTFLVDRTPGSNLNGAMDNIKIEGVATNTYFQEKINNRNNVGYETELGYVFDDENIFFAGATVIEVPELILKVENFAALPWAVPFYWLLAVTWSNQTNDNRTTNIRFPKVIIDSGTAVSFYLSTDMSLYFEQKLIRLGATSNV